MENQPDTTSSNKQQKPTPQESNINIKEPDKSINLFSKASHEKNRQKLVRMIDHTAESARDCGLTESEIRPILKNTFNSMKQSKFGPFEDGATGVKLSEVETQQIDWLWPNRIPLGKITILDGNPGIGKSLLAMTIASYVSTGHPMPDGTPGKQGGIILIAPEDSAEDTIKPRIEAAGCDPSQVLLLNTTLCFDENTMYLYERTFSLSRDLEELELEINRVNAILVVIDPLMAVLGRNIDSSRDQDVREVFTPLAQLAERTGSAILIIRHLNKGNSANILYRGSGSIGIIASARMGLLVAQDPHDEQKRVFATIKNNLSKVAPNLTFQIIENERGIPYIQWLGENHHATSTLLRPGTSISYERQEILRALKDASGPLDTKEISERTGIKYASLRSILHRMQDASEIVRLNRGKYTSPNHPSFTRESLQIIASANETNATSATSATNSASDLPPPEK